MNNPCSDPIDAKTPLPSATRLPEQSATRTGKAERSDSNFALKRKQCSGIFGGAIRATSPVTGCRKRILGHPPLKNDSNSAKAEKLRYPNATDAKA
jgi:hypothetical protein